MSHTPSPIIGDGAEPITDTTYKDSFHPYNPGELEDDEERKDAKFRRKKSSIAPVPKPPQPPVEDFYYSGDEFGHGPSIVLTNHSSGIPLPSRMPRDRKAGGGGSLSLRGPADMVTCSNLDIRVDGRDGASSLASSLSDVSSITSSRSGVSRVRGTTATRLRQELVKGKAKADQAGYMTPLQRKERELKSLRQEFTHVLRAVEEKDRELECLIDDKRAEDEERRPEEERKRRALEDLEFRVHELEAQLRSTTEEWERAVQECVELKNEMAQKDEQFETCYSEMYQKGVDAARFEREEEWQLHKDKKGRTTMSRAELERKLLRTEEELAKWQSIRLEESYNNNNAILAKPEDATTASLAFIKDAFFHFVIDPSPTNTNLHLSAITGIFQYSDSQVARMKERLEERNKMDAKKK